MIDKGERVMHITTHHIPAKRRHIDAETRLRRLSHVVAVSTRVVRGCKFPRRPSARFSSYAESRRPAFSVGRSTRHVPILRLSEVFATPLQTPKKFSKHLQRRCKRQKVFRSTCNTVANTRKFLVALATPLQTPKSFSRHLQHRCKRQKVFRGICNTVANTQKNLGAFATLLQTFSFQRTKLFTKSLAPDPLLTPF